MNERTSEVITGNFFDKYGSRNPVHKRLMAGFHRAFDELSSLARPRQVFELGCGEGALSLRLLDRNLDVRGSDIGSDVVMMANRASERAGYGTRFETRSIYDHHETSCADLVVACEVLEHLDDPDGALHIIRRMTRRYALMSVPSEPLWRAMNMARLKYLSNLGNTPGHVQHWSTRSFVRFVATTFDIVEIRRPLPWTFVLAEKRQ